MFNYEMRISHNGVADVIHMRGFENARVLFNALTTDLLQRHTTDAYVRVIDCSTGEILLDYTCA